MPCVPPFQQSCASKVPSRCLRANVNRWAARESAVLRTVQGFDELQMAHLNNDWWWECMRRGNFEQAWATSDKLLNQRRGQPCTSLPRHLQWGWDGSPLEGKRVLVRCYHGLGDTI